MAILLMINRYFPQYDELDKDQNNQHGDFNIYPQCVELGKDYEDEDSNEELEDNSCDKEESLHRVMSLGGACEFREFPDMSHGWTTRGDIRSALYHNDYEHFRIFSILVTFYNHKDFAETQQ